MLIVGKPLLTISDRWKLPLSDCISDNSYVSLLERATNIDWTIKNHRKKKQDNILYIFQGGFSLPELISFGGVQKLCRVHSLVWGFVVMWIKATLQLSSSSFLDRWPSAERNLTSSSSLLSSTCRNWDLLAFLFPFLMDFQQNTSYSEKSISLSLHLYDSME